MAPPAKRPRKEPAPRTVVPPPKQIKRKAQPLESLPVEYNASHECHEDTRTMSTQTTNCDQQRASVSYHRSKSRKLLEKLAKEDQRIAFYRENKHHDSVRKIEADSRNGLKKAGFLIHEIERYDNYSANTTMFKHMGNGSLHTVITHPHDPNRVIFLSFDPCHVIRNIRSHFLERQITDLL
ncbi:hypothetical protein HPB50_025539 [Hyalomma asiaticum]|uniref:Uncharacterized protein n=1 Tax=Hyalomma asiaticum TaxID=266040 RepID=A0ACB7RPA8_HYAAI|nr:hypothetical protein HPB50_025539 [Hyalomma asiaticum]